MEVKFHINGEEYSGDVPGDKPLLWVLREDAKYTGTKFGCGAGLCGACTVVIDGQAMRSCLTPASFAEGKKVETIESLEEDAIGKELLAQWDKVNVSQCGYCQPGQLMSAVSLLRTNANPSEQEIINAMDGNLCRCGTYPKIRQAIGNTAKEIRS